ncbi:hypothetical protein RJT34_04555 [Clitoria ternatea]|uniref:Uncharacterized protein n=1 Tax=Clitoria ternatea TaxID=43366 RepID=A0AAN9KLT5_CLITE
MACVPHQNSLSCLSDLSPYSNSSPISNLSPHSELLPLSNLSPRSDSSPGTSRLEKIIPQQLPQETFQLGTQLGSTPKARNWEAFVPPGLREGPTAPSLSPILGKNKWELFLLILSSSQEFRAGKKEHFKEITQVNDASDEEEEEIFQVELEGYALSAAFLCSKD